MDVESVAHFEGLPGEYLNDEEPPECRKCGGMMRWHDGLHDWVCPFCNGEQDDNGESHNGNVHT